MRLFLSLSLLATVTAQVAPQIICDTTVPVGDGKITIELWPKSAPHGVTRLSSLVKDGFFTDLPFFRAIPNFLIQFGISPDAAMMNKWNSAGNIEDDPHSTVPFTDGIVSYAGYGPNSRSTHLFLTLGNQPGLGKSPWEVPVGKVVKGLDVMKGIYTGYGDKVDQGRLNPQRKDAKAYLASFPRLDRFKGCKLIEGQEHQVEL